MLHLLLIVLLLGLLVPVVWLFVRFARDEDLFGIFVECLHYEWERFHVSLGVCLIGFLVSLGFWTAAILADDTFDGMAHFALIVAVLFLCRAVREPASKAPDAVGRSAGVR